MTSPCGEPSSLPRVKDEVESSRHSTQYKAHSRRDKFALAFRSALTCQRCLCDVELLLTRQQNCVFKTLVVEPSLIFRSEMACKRSDKYQTVEEYLEWTRHPNPLEVIYAHASSCVVHVDHPKPTTCTPLCLATKGRQGVVPLQSPR
jgi:hypothetical protein